MTVFDEASVMLAISDYAALDGIGKVNALGLGIGIVGLQPHGLSAPQSLLIFIDVPARYAGQKADITIELRNLTDDTVVSTPTQNGRTEAVRVMQTAKLEKVDLPGALLPPDMPIRVQMLIGFPNGIALAPGKVYAWKLSIDHRSRKSWRATFAVPAALPMPVVGGPAGPASIPEIASIDLDVIEPEDDPPSS